MEVINSSLLRRFAENLYEGRVKVESGPPWKSPRKYIFINQVLFLIQK